MGLAISQVRLLALTNRKADIELQMQINSKRKQQLTRRSTELSQEYYNRLQNSSIQYATSNGYEDVDYSYVMGQTTGTHYTSDFLQQVSTGSSLGVAQKPTDAMILTNQFGEVVVNDDIALVVEKMKDSFAGEKTSYKTAQGIIQLISDMNNSSLIVTPTAISKIYEDLISSIANEDMVKYISAIMKNGGYQNGGTVYTDGTSYYSNVDGKTENLIPHLQDGYCYTVLHTGTSSSVRSSTFYCNGDFQDKISNVYAQALANITSYFAPIISAALSNGTSTEVSRKTIDGKTEAAATVTSIPSGASGYFITIDTDNNKHYWYKASSTTPAVEYTGADIGNKFYTYTVDNNANFTNAMKTENLQTGFKSGSYQLAMVDDIARGGYHKNTTMTYFTHMKYVVDRTDSSKREEITAWFNTEQAKISDKETYWDTEIQNLSTELQSVNTEIDSVKSLKSNAIKSVFNWGGN